jgi:hypothetical protein
MISDYDYSMNNILLNEHALLKQIKTIIHNQTVIAETKNDWNVFPAPYLTVQTAHHGKLNLRN